MVAERQDRYPKGTYRLIVACRGGKPIFHLTNLITKTRCCCPSVWCLLNALDRDLTACRYPQKTVQYRTWETKKMLKDSEQNTPTDPTVPTGAAPTFIIRVLYRQNATWQGSIQWVEGKQTRQFRSEFEMLKLMDEAMHLTIEDHEPTATNWNT